MRELIQRSAAGDQEAFGRLASAVVDRLLVIARLVLRDEHAAEDAVQEALIRAWRELPRLRDPDRFEAWMRRLVINACKDEGRRRSRQPAVRLLPGTEPTGALDGYRTLEARDRLGRAFSRLPVEQRAVLVLAHYLGLSEPEIAATLGVPLGTVKSRLRYGIRSMRAAIEADERPAFAEPQERLS